MKPPIIMAAFGTTSAATTTYEYLETEIQKRFPGHSLHWAYSSRMVRSLASKNSKPPQHPHQVLRELQEKGTVWAVVQSLHLTAGYEFYRLQEEVSTSSLRVSLGLPLLYAPSDFDHLAACLKPQIEAHPEEAIVLIGHGTDHHTWSTYPALEKSLRKEFGDHIYIGVTEEYPPREETVAEVVAGGRRKIFMIPLLLVAGMHFQKDMMGPASNSYQTLFEREGLEVSASTQGIGMLPKVSDIICNHIEDALDVIPDK